MFRLARFIVTLIVAAWLLTLVGPVLTAYADPDPTPTATATVTPTDEPTATPPPITDSTPPPPTAEPTTTPPPVEAPNDWLPVTGPPWNDPSVPGGVHAGRACYPARWLAMETVPGTSEADAAFRRVSPEVVVTWPGSPDTGFCSVAKLVAKPVAKPVVAPAPVLIDKGPMPKTLPRTGPAVSTWLLLLVALGCFALGGLMFAFGNRTPKPLPLRKDAGAITLPVLRRTAALVAAVTLGSAGTFLAVSQVTNQRVTPLVQAVFTATPLGPAQSVPFVPGHFYEGSQAWANGHPVGAVWLLPVDLSGYDLPGGAVIRVRTASGTVENCTHSKGSGVSTNGWTGDGAPITGDGWKCVLATPAPKPVVKPVTPVVDQLKSGALLLCASVKLVPANCGVITIALNGTKSPKPFASIIRLAESGRWVSTPCPRNKVALGGFAACGDPLARSLTGTIIVSQLFAPPLPKRP